MKNILEVKKVNLEVLNSVEYAHFLKNMLDISKGVELEHLNIEQEVLDKLVKCQEDLTEATRQVRFSAESQKINELDKQRDEYVSFFLSSLRIEQKNPMKQRKEAASILYKNLKSYLGIQKLPVGQKTQTINGLLVDISKADLKKNITLLGLDHAVTSLTKANENYHKEVAGRSENQLSNVLINSKKVRKEATELYRYLVKCVEGKYIVSQAQETASFITLLNKVVTDTMTANKMRLAQANAAKKAAENTETPKPTK